MATEIPNPVREDAIVVLIFAMFLALLVTIWTLTYE